MKKVPFFSLFILAFVLVTGCKNENQTEPIPGDQLGEIHISFSGNEAAMPHFTKGLKLLHNFEYDDACKEFIAAQKADSTFAMAYWGEAMTYNHPLWRQQDYEKGREALSKLAPTPGEQAAMAMTGLEKDFLQGMEIMYGEGENKKERDSLYNAHLERMYDTYPGNEEVAAFYALSILGAVKAGRNEQAYEKGAAIVEGILKENPNHPGALHYLIHSYDDPSHAPRALPAAFSYSKVAADATHALHMPSHIFVAVGMWDEVIKSNIASWQASVRKVKEMEDPKNAGSYHALHWLMYGLLQKGQVEEAKKLLVDMNQYATDSPTEQAHDYLIAMKGNFLAETDEWSSEVSAFKTELDDLNILVKAKSLFLDGMKYYEQNDPEDLANVIAQMEEQRARASNLVSAEGIPMCASPGASNNAPNKVDIEQATVMELELKALHTSLSGADKQAEKWFRQATDLESSTSYSYGPPDIVKPSYELYGEWLMTYGRASQAAEQFDKALQKGPKRKRALEGRLQAAKLLKDEAKVKELEKTLAEVVKTGEYEL